MTKGITIVGLGPGDPAHWTVEARGVLAKAQEVHLRTRHHPAVAALPPHLTVHSFDHLYEEGETFDQVYRAIAERVLDLGQRPQGVIYAVPGHPLVGEESVRRILEGARERGVPVRIVAGLSFIEPVLTHLELDPLSGLQIVDAMDLAARHHPNLDPDLPALVGQLYCRELAADVKLTLLNLYPPEHPVTLVQAAGTAEEASRTFPLYELDRQEGMDDLTTLHVPPLPRPSSLTTLQDVVAHLRAPDGCPWDREQTHQTLRPYLLEEAYEVLAALDADDPQLLREELGDLLLQILLHAQIAVEEGEFSLAQVAESIIAKLIHRHPHVFGDVMVADAQEVIRNWEQLKREERGERGGIFSGIPASLPALACSQEIQKRVARLGFDWPDREGVWAKVEEELRELREARGEGRAREFGDLLFVLVNLARWLGVD
ncbi:TPA: nucleoside triphosphate pyrophosphohydrolase, partial [Candidatus Bipolaricaulota bacterium]|nr:nucleoside triphosphate pyrophosphohydrolase [Candidatus Bipolaricaulota bacterium]